MTLARTGDIARLARRPDPARELEAWRLAVTHLHARGLPAPCPEFAYRWLRRRGVRADWVAGGTR